jgi:hypothetical protein
MPGEILPESELNRHLFQTDPTPIADHQPGVLTDTETITMDQQNNGGQS